MLSCGTSSKTARRPKEDARKPGMRSDRLTLCARLRPAAGDVTDVSGDFRRASGAVVDLGARGAHQIPGLTLSRRIIETDQQPPETRIRRRRALGCDGSYHDPGAGRMRSQLRQKRALKAIESL